MQNKQYPRAWWVPGRLRVQLKNADGTPVNPEIPNSEWLRHTLCAMHEQWVMWGLVALQVCMHASVCLSAWVETGGGLLLL